MNICVSLVPRLLVLYSFLILASCTQSQENSSEQGSSDIKSICSFAESFAWSKYKNNEMEMIVDFESDLQKKSVSVEAKNILQAAAQAEPNARWNLFQKGAAELKVSVKGCHKLKLYMLKKYVELWEQH